MKVEKISENRVRYTFEITVDEFAHGLDHAFDIVKDKVELKGFRKGHVPRNVYDSKFGAESLYEEALNHVLHHKFEEAIAYDEFEIVGHPNVELDYSKVSHSEPFELSLVAPIKPDVVLGKYLGLESTEEEVVVTEEEVLEYLKDKIEDGGSLELKDGELEEGDTAIFDFEGFVDDVAFEGGKAENHELEIGSGQFIPGFEEGMLGMKSGETRDVAVTFPEAYHAEELKGKDAVFKVVLHEIKHRVAPELTDEWVVSLNEDAQTVDEYKQVVKDLLLNNKQTELKNKTLETLLEEIAKTSTVDVPQEMFDFEVEQNKQNIENQAKQYGIDYDTYLQLSGVDKITFEDQLKVDSEKRVLNSLIIEAIAKKEAIEISDDEVEKRFDELANQYNMPKEEVKKYIDSKTIKQDIAFSKTLDLIFNSRIVK